MDLDDKVCEPGSRTLLSEVSPKAVIERCVQQSEPWASKARRVRASTVLALVLFVMGMARREPRQPTPGVAKPGGPTQRCASGRAHQHDQRLGTQWTRQGLGV